MHQCLLRIESNLPEPHAKIDRLMAIANYPSLALPLENPILEKGPN